MKKIIISRNPMNYKTYHTEIQFEDGEIEPISFNKIIDEIGKTKEKIEEKNEKNYINQAMRKEIKDQIIKYKNNSILLCENCKIENLDKIDYHVDHIIKFRDIQENFMTKYKELEILMEDDQKYGNKKLINNTFSEKWKNYHEKHAKLRILCKACNTKLGTKNLY